MAHKPYVEKISRLTNRLVARRDEQGPERTVRQFSYSDEIAPFLEYFYNTEQTVLLTNNFETYGERFCKSAQFFRDEDELNEYIDKLTDYSSNDEDRPVASDLPFVDSDNNDAYDKLLQQIGFVPPLTQQQITLLSNISIYEIHDTDGPDQIARKKDRRMQLVRGYCKELKRKRYAKAYRRFNNVRSKRLVVGLESMALLEAEVHDKHLNQSRDDEPEIFRMTIQTIRKLALKRKFLQYVIDPIYRQSYRKRIYYNVNMDVPDDLMVDGRNQVFIMNRSTADQMNQSMNDSVLRKVPNVYNDDRNSGEFKMDAFVMDESAIGEPLANSTRYNVDQDIEYESLGVPLASSTMNDVEQDFELEDDFENYQQGQDQSKQLIPQKDASKSSTTQSHKMVKEFADPTNPNATIRVEKAVTAHSINDADAQSVSNATHMTVQRIDALGNVTKKEFNFNQGTRDRVLPAIYPAAQSVGSSQSRALADKANESIIEALELVSRPMFQENPGGAGMPFPLVHSQGVFEWFFRHMPNGGFFDQAVEGVKE